MLKVCEYKIHPNHMSKQVCTRIVETLSPENAQQTLEEVNIRIAGLPVRNVRSMLHQGCYDSSECQQTLVDVACNFASRF